MFVFGLFLGLVFGVDGTKYRRCQDSPFCARNRFVEAQRWEANVTGLITTGTTLFVPVLDGMYGHFLNLSLAFLSSNLIHVELVPTASERFKRYECAREPTVVNQTVLNSHMEFSLESNTSHIIVKCDNRKAVIHASPFTIDVFDGSVLKLSLNPDDSAVFETNLDRQEFPDHWTPANFGHYPETLRDGPASVAMTVKFHEEGTRLSGLATHTLNLSLTATVENGKPVTDPIRFYNTDINSFEIGSVMAMYSSIPYLVGHNIHGSTSAFWCNPSETWVDIDTNNSTARFVSETGLIDIFVTSGKHSDVIRSYTNLTGRPAMPQLFALGYHQCRWTYMSEKELREVSENLDKAKIPHDALWMDLDHTNGHRYFTFNSGYQNMEKMVSDFMKFKRRVVAQVDPHLKVDPNYNVFARAKEKGVLMKSRDGRDYQGHCWPGTSGWVDFLNPEARYWWSQQYRYDLYKGSSRYLFTWNDMNEPAVFDVPDMSVPRDTQHFGGYEDRSVHNLYGHLMVASTYKGHIMRNEDRNERPFVLTRSLFSGSQKYAFMWTGDNTANWDQLRNSVTEVLSLGVCGFPFAGADVGGFFDSPDSELLTRWYQAGAFCYPFFRCHCHHLSARREPYRLPEGYLDAARKAIVERYQLLPVWYTASRVAHECGAPVIRPLWWEFGDEEALDMESEVMLFDALLVAPVFEKGAALHRLFFPRGIRWYDFRTLSEVSVEGHTDITLDGKIGDVPVFVRGGRTIPVRRTQRQSAELMNGDPVDLIVALDGSAESKGRLYLDDGHTFGFERGECIDKVFNFTGGRLTSKDLHSPAKDSEFWREYNACIRDVEVVGLRAKPTRVLDNSGKEVAFQWDNGVVRILNLGYPVKADWQLDFNL